MWFTNQTSEELFINDNAICVIGRHYENYKKLESK